jgi:hypothetical protein
VGKSPPVNNPKIIVHRLCHKEGGTVFLHGSMIPCGRFNWKDGFIRWRKRGNRIPYTPVFECTMVEIRPHGAETIICLMGGFLHTNDLDKVKLFVFPAVNGRVCRQYLYL